MAKEFEKRIEVTDPFAKRLMVRYLGHRKEELESLRSALSGSDFETIRITGHNLFGSGSAYGLDRISELGADLEAAASNKNADNIAHIIDLLEHYVSNVRVI